MENPIDIISSENLRQLVEESKSFSQLLTIKLKTHKSSTNKKKLIQKLHILPYLIQVLEVEGLIIFQSIKWSIFIKLIIMMFL
jgi:hypothetical protein